MGCSLGVRGFDPWPFEFRCSLLLNNICKDTEITLWKCAAEARGRVDGVCLFVLTVRLFRLANDNGANDQAALNEEAEARAKKLGSPVVPFYPFLGEGSPTEIDYRKKLVPLF